MLTIKTWRTPATEYPDRTLGRARIKTIRYRGFYRCYGLRGHRYFRAGNIRVKRLLIGGQGWMIDDPPHWWAMEEHATFYQGRVLVAGLGLGLIVHTLHANPAVQQIVVIEREKDVIDLVSPFMPHGKLEILHGDFWDYAGPTPDGVFFDLLVGDGYALLPDALVSYSQMLQWFPSATIRIHGYNNKMFEPIGRAIQEAIRAYR
jgi:hypothetical protein